MCQKGQNPNYIHLTTKTFNIFQTLPDFWGPMKNLEYHRWATMNWWDCEEKAIFHGFCLSYNIQANLCYVANNAMLAKFLSDFQGQIKKAEKIIVGRTINRWDSEEKAILPGNFQFSDKASSLASFWTTLFAPKVFWETTNFVIIIFSSFWWEFTWEWRVVRR